MRTNGEKTLIIAKLNPNPQTYNPWLWSCTRSLRIPQLSLVQPHRLLKHSCFYAEQGGQFQLSQEPATASGTVLILLLIKTPYLPVGTAMPPHPSFSQLPIHRTRRGFRWNEDLCPSGHDETAENSGSFPRSGYR
jgi:hypothetical protein